MFIVCFPIVYFALPHSAATAAVIDELAQRMDAGDIIVDCGNTLFHVTPARLAALKERGSVQQHQ